MKGTLIFNFIRSPAMAASSFYTQMYGSSTPSDGGDFGSLWRTVRGTGQVSWRLAIIIFGFLLAITGLISVMMLFSATKGNSRDEAKARIGRVLIIAFFAGGLLGIVSILTTIF